MEIINENGKILGLINLFDLFVLILLVLLAFTSYRYIIQKQWPNIPEPEHPKNDFSFINRIITLQLSETNEILENILKTGFNYTFSDNTSLIITNKSREITEYTNITFLKISANMKKINENLYLNNEFVKINFLLSINTEKITINGNVNNIE